MFMNLLPGLRELRAPLICGYLWLTTAWLLLGHMDWLPSSRPPGNGEVARLWDLGDTLGRTVVLAILTFVAYLIGSFLEIHPDGRIANLATPIILRDRTAWYLRGSYTDFRMESATRSAEKLGIHFEPSMAMRVAQSVSREARRDLKNILELRNMIPTTENLPNFVGPLGQSSDLSIADRTAQDQNQATRIDGKQIEVDPRRRKEDERNLNLMREMACDWIISDIIQEMQQLASRLLVKNENLYGKYDRQMAEASVRMNVSLPLTALLLLAVWLSNLAVWLQLVLTLITLAFGFVLLRQGFLRAISARDVIVQALTIGQVKSRHIPTDESTESFDQKPAAIRKRTEPM
jgi:hypothetical protein